VLQNGETFVILHFVAVSPFCNRSYFDDFLKNEIKRISFLDCVKVSGLGNDCTVSRRIANRVGYESFQLSVPPPEKHEKSF
jgi:hypothetical protein